MCSFNDYLELLIFGPEEDDSPQQQADGGTESSEENDVLASPDSDYKYVASSRATQQKPSRREDLPDQSEFDVVSLRSLSSGRVYEISEFDDREILFIDPENAADANKESASEVIEDGKQKSGGLTPEENEPLVGAYESGGKTYIEELEDFYQNRIPDDYMDMIRESAMLRFAERYDQLSLLDVRKRKAQIANPHDAGLNIASMCSSGYFDGDGIFQIKFREHVLNGSDTVDEYREEFIRITNESPFVEFVENDSRVDDVYANALRKAIKISDYRWEFECLHVRGSGPNTRDTVDGVAEEFIRHHSDLNWELENEFEDRVFKFTPESL